MQYIQSFHVLLKIYSVKKWLLGGPWLVGPDIGSIVFIVVVMTEMCEMDGQAQKKCWLVKGR